MFKTVNCPECKISHETYIHGHHVYNDLRCDECIFNILKIGQKAIYHDSDGNKTEHIIEEYNDDLCGDGCCQGYKLSSIDGYVWKTAVEGIYE